MYIMEYDSALKMKLSEQHLSVLIKHKLQNDRQHKAIYIKYLNVQNFYVQLKDRNADSKSIKLSMGIQASTYLPGAKDGNRTGVSDCYLLL